MITCLSIGDYFAGSKRHFIRVQRLRSSECKTGTHPSSTRLA